MSTGMKTQVATALLALASRAYSQLATTCPTSGICYSLNIPSNTASSGNGDIFFQISAPDSLSWVALGQGSSMSGSNIFVVYAAGNGNVTISPRLGKGHSMPEYNSAAEVTLLEGSGVSNGKMIANVKCSNCQSWSGGSMDFTASSASWIHASKSGGALDTTDQSASISQHGGDAGAFTFQFANAKGGNDVNPFVSSSSKASASGGAFEAASGGNSATATSSCTPRPKSASSTWPTTAAASATKGGAWPTEFPSSWRTAWPTARPSDWPNRRDSGDDDGNYCDDSSSASNGDANQANAFQALEEEYQREMRMRTAHGVLAALAFVLFFPAGAISIRLLSFPGLVWFHAAMQMFAYAVYIAAFALGVYLAGKFNLRDNYHPKIGIVIFALLFFQPILGFLHHALFKKYSRRTFWSYAHLWLGRIIITMGIINGGLGLKLANNSKSGEIAYGVIAGAIWLIYVAAAVIGEVRKARAARDAPPKYEGS